MQVIHALKEIQFFLAEDVRTARRFLSSLKIYPSIESLSFETLNKDTPRESLRSLLKPLLEGKHMGILSESGCPGVADPGAMAVEFAHQHRIEVKPLVGPSSILLSLMASGLNGQNFAFHGYLPIDSKEATKAIKDYERESRLKNQTQIFIETPYRNNAILEHLLKNLSPDAKLCIAIDVTGSQERIETKSIKEWAKNKPVLAKNPAVFLFFG